MSVARPFRFGAGLFGAESRAEWTELARRAEALGYAMLLVPDHFQRQLAPIAALMAAADATSTLRVGSYVCNNDFRHPALLAKEAATLDLLSEGRFEFGIGAGWAEPEYSSAGIPFDRPGARLARLSEALEIITALFRGGTLAFSGKHYQIEGLEGYPLPLQQPHPPLLLGGSGERMLALAARKADIVSFTPARRASDAPSGESSTAALRRMAGWAREAAGTRWPELELNTFFFDVAVDDDSTKAREMIARKRNVPVEDVPQQLHALAGSPSEVVEQLLGLREELGISYVVAVGAAEMEALAPVVARLTGS
ncbi:MAG TPA: TIGR03621 family F420-dependent LLM class oxidoreductase [Thermomicrobiaceae bacterium]|nr:TIGR03621 family F420-dependent LLM class oxidoreductase [Thermomicrobiaceae bacterium]